MWHSMTLKFDWFWDWVHDGNLSLKDTAANGPWYSYATSLLYSSNNKISMLQWLEGPKGTGHVIDGFL